MAQGIPPLPPVGSPVLSAATARQAAEVQAKVTGGAGNTALQAKLQAERGLDENAKRAAQALVPRTPGGLLLGLERVRRDRRSDDDTRRPRVPQPLEEESTAAGG